MIYITIQNDSGESGIWEMEPHLYEIFHNFMLALESGNSKDLRWQGNVELGSYHVRPRLTNCGERRIYVIKIIRQYYGLSLKDAKEITDKVPVNLPSLPWSSAQAFAAEVHRESAGSIVELPNILERIVSAIGSPANQENKGPIA